METELISENMIEEGEMTMTQLSFRRRLIPTVTFAIVFLIGGTAMAEKAQAPSALKQLDDAYVQVAERVTPEVVNISSTKKGGSASMGEGMEPFFKNFPFHEFFGDEFGKQFKGKMPRPHGGSMRVAMGSGFIVTPDGMILTNSHVVKDMDEIKVTLPGKKSYTAKVIGIDPDSDIAVIKIPATGLPTVRFGDSSKLRVGEIVLAVGNPFGFNGTVTSGIVSATGRTNVGIIGYEDFIQTDAAINPGNSGGPLVNIQGEVIGVTTAIATRSGGYQGIGFAIPSNSAKIVMDELIKHGKVTRGLLGVNIQDLNDSLAKSFGLTDTNGALVAQVVPGSPAEKAGIKAGDVILKFNGKVVTGAAELKNVVGREKPGSTAKLTVFRDKKSFDVSVTVGERTPKALAEAPTGAAGGAASTDLGVTVEKVPAAAAEKMKLKAGVGLAVKEVNPDSVGSKMGLQEGDVILEIDGKAVSDVSTFNQEVAAAKKNKVIRLKIHRGSATIFLATTLE
jgi:Do/DeqQ family serine protease